MLLQRSLETSFRSSDVEIRFTFPTAEQALLSLLAIPYRILRDKVRFTSLIPDGKLGFNHISPLAHTVSCANITLYMSYCGSEMLFRGDVGVKFSLGGGCGGDYCGKCVLVGVESLRNDEPYTRLKVLKRITAQI